jgi:hypothetical protein
MEKRMKVLLKTMLGILGIVMIFIAVYCNYIGSESQDTEIVDTTTVTTEIANKTFRFIAIGENEYVAIGKLNNVTIDVGESIQDALIFQDGNKTKDIHVLNAEEWQWSLGEWYKVRIKVAMDSQILDAKTIEPVVRVVIPKYKYQ